MTDENLILKFLNTLEDKAINAFNIKIKSYTISFDLNKKKCLGQYLCLANKKHHLQFNRQIIDAFGVDKYLSVVRHEFAHMVAVIIYDSTKIKPHGKEWRKIMIELGDLNPKAVSIDFIAEVAEEIIMTCNCMKHFVPISIFSTHNNLLCNKCNSALIRIK